MSKAYILHIYMRTDTQTKAHWSKKRKTRETKIYNITTGIAFSLNFNLLSVSYVYFRFNCKRWRKLPDHRIAPTLDEFMLENRIAHRRSGNSAQDLFPQIVLYRELYSWRFAPLPLGMTYTCYSSYGGNIHRFFFIYSLNNIIKYLWEDLYLKR